MTRRILGLSEEIDDLTTQITAAITTCHPALLDCYGVDRIAANAEANKRAIYDYFGDKNRLTDADIQMRTDRYYADDIDVCWVSSVIACHGCARFPRSP
ncbi:hypothetical protein ACQPZ8_28640 [Actinomadura nitritigenes]|uniref:hypothetical protein n=1 Tax=Actinomadura nitritigenes TaxID=134602 RepID=UPI003D923142